MKFIVKDAELQELIDWKQDDKMFQRGNPKWDRLTPLVKDKIRESLKREQGYICCYCERELIPNDYHIEHIKPKGFPIYKKFQIDYDNLLCSCQNETAKGEPRHCARSKDNWYDLNLFISPLDPLCEDKFTYTYDGHILPADPNDNAALATILKLQLFTDKMNNYRKAVIDLFIDDEITDIEVSILKENYLIHKDKNGGKFNAFYTTIKNLF